ncbi:MAG: glycosyltransferase family A protein, partial [Thermodesulfobacteriota bacterium]
GGDRVTPRVSVVVTTRGRPQLVGRAVASALAQTLRELEVIVVLDGPDPATLAALRELEDARVRLHVRDARGGQAAAINSGVALARGAFAAMLDDDDEWLPDKLAVQLAAAEASAHARPVVGCRFLARSEADDVAWPLRRPRAGEPACEYLFCRTMLAFGEGIVPTSMLLAPTDLFRRHPMAEDLPKHCDLDWLLRVDRLPDVALVLPADPRPLAIWQQQAGRHRLSNVHDWRFSYAWVGRARDAGDVSARAYAGFLLTWVSFSARVQRDRGAFAFLVKEALRRGHPSALELAVHAGVWGMPSLLRARASRALARRGHAHAL